MPVAGWIPWTCWTASFVLIASAGTWLARRYAVRRRLLDEPGERRSHRLATPRGGGIAIVVAMLVAILMLMAFDPDRIALLGAMGVGLCLVAGVGWADDHASLSPWSRLSAQALAALLLGWAVADAGAGPAIGAMTGVLAMVLVNIWNFMDGIDGIAVTQCLIVALAYGWLATGDAQWLALALVGACLGFLPFNFPRARIFLGDVGSGALGYLLATLVGWLLVPDPQFERVPILLLPLTAFGIDAALTLAARVLRRERWWLPHAQHAYQQWARRIGGHAPVTLAYAGWTIVMTACMLVASRQPLAFTMWALSVTTLVGALAWSALRRKPMEGSRTPQ